MASVDETSTTPPHPLQLTRAGTDGDCRARQHSHDDNSSSRHRSSSNNGDIAQQPLRHVLNAPPSNAAALLRRSYAPRCPECGVRFAHPPPAWECPHCWRRGQLSVKVWQPDTSTSECSVCGASIGRWSRHHCRSCGRLTCSRCCSARALLPRMGFDGPEKVCDECAKLHETQPAHTHNNNNNNNRRAVM